MTDCAETTVVVYQVVEADSVWNSHMEARETAGIFSTREKAEARVAYMNSIEGIGWRVQEETLDSAPTSAAEEAPSEAVSDWDKGALAMRALIVEELRENAAEVRADLLRSPEQVNADFLRRSERCLTQCADYIQGLEPPGHP